ncbi:phenylacetate--CoA ligase [Sulfurospirillum sp. T05]|uniref:Phenylacetate-coenzyme A ligase n=1 Tax=Sulfurospirillum tamanense TaxID=2813362 RepID=A0ABS2WS97_9BACT|nr:phenylacetate--CoA ligase [Sulfurospirillum tamanensis]MBN2964546.1 phenylacetate--CoA ligase [Sulfurospirillum tamanensis]
MTCTKAETLDRASLEALQFFRLKETLERVYARVPFYKNAFDGAGVSPRDIIALCDLERLPFTKKQDLRDNYPFGLFAVPMEQIVRIHSSSGTTGKPTVVGYTEHDMDVWAEVVGRIFTMGGLTSCDILQNSTGYGLFTGGLGFHTAAERMKIAVVPSSTGFTSRQLLLLKDFGATAITGTPSFALHMAELAKAEGYDLHKDFRLKVGFFGAEPASRGLKEEIATTWGIDYHEVYGLSEIIGPGVAGSCKHSALLHINEDHFYPEIIDSLTCKPVPDGQRGELVITTLTKHGLPIIRYRTGDITSLTREPCACGRTLARIESIAGRSDDMLVINGVNVFPSQIEHVLSCVQGVTLNYQIIAKKKGHLDKLEVDVELDESLMRDDVAALERLKKECERSLLNHLYINVAIRLVAPKSIVRSEGKAVRVIDQRS